MEAGARRAGLADLPDDVLLLVAAQLPMRDRRRLSAVCRKLRVACAAPSHLWSAVDVILDDEAALGSFMRCVAAPASLASVAVPSSLRVCALVPGLGGCALKPAWLRPRAWCAASSGSPMEGRSLLPPAPLHPPRPPPACRWAIPRGSAIDRLRVELGAALQLSDHELRTLPGDVLRLGGAHELQPTRLAVTAPAWGGSMQLGAIATPRLRKLALFGGLQLMVSPASAAPPAALTDFSLIGGTLGGQLDAAWLPPSLTALVCSDASLQAVPGVVRSLPALRSLVRAGGCGGLAAVPTAPAAPAKRARTC